MRTGKGEAVDKTATNTGIVWEKVKRSTNAAIPIGHRITMVDNGTKPPIQTPWPD